MRIAWPLSLLIALTLGGRAFADASVTTSAPPTAGCARLPSGWRVEELARAAAGDSVRHKDAVVLAWQIDEDNRPLRVEAALVWIARDDGTFTVANLYRHPRDRNEWRISAVYDVPYVGAQTWTRAPSRAELERFFGETWWHFRARDRFRLLGAEVCAAGWKRATGVAPWRAYP